MPRRKNRRVVDQSRGLLTALDECSGREPPALALNVKSVSSAKYSMKSMKCPQCTGWSGQLADRQMKCISDISLPIWPVCRIYVHAPFYIAAHVCHYCQCTYTHIQIYYLLYDAFRELQIIYKQCWNILLYSRYIKNIGVHTYSSL